jgi:hypothetical protein
MTAAELLERTAARIEQPGRWVQGTMHVYSRDGVEASCIYGTMRLISNNYAAIQEACAAIKCESGYEVAPYNDTPGLSPFEAATTCRNAKRHLVSA